MNTLPLAFRELWRTGTGLLISTLLLSSPLRGHAADPSEARVQLADVPEAARKAIQTKAGDARLGEIRRYIEDGETSYDVELLLGNQIRSFSVDDAGQVLEEEITLAEAPPPVQKAIRAHLRKGQLEEIDRANDEGEITYVVTFTLNGQERDFTLDGAGRLLETQVFLPELSAALQAAITKAAGVGVLGDIYKTFDDGEVFYEVDITDHGKTRTVTFDPDGAPVDEAEPVAFGDAPALVQQALNARRRSGARLLGLDKVTEDGEVTFEAEVLDAGKHRPLSLRPDGTPRAE